MTHAVVRFGDLGYCWLPAQRLNSCLPCSRYDTCTYPERQWHIEYERNRRERAVAAARVASLDDEARNLMR